MKGLVALPKQGLRRSFSRFSRFSSPVLCFGTGMILFLLLWLLCGITSAKTTIVYWIWDLNQKPATEQLIQMYHKAHTDIQVRLEVIPYGEYWNKLPVALAGDAGPDVFWVNPNNYASLVMQGALLDLTPFLNQDPDAMANFRRMLPLLQRLYTFDDRVYAIPRDFDTIAVVYNADAVEEAGLEAPAKVEATWDWNTFATYAQKLTKWKGDQMVRAGYMLAVWAQGIYYNPIWSNKGEIFSEDGKRCTLSSPAVVQAVQWLADLQLKLRVASGAYIPTGKSAMETNGSWIMRLYRQQIKFKWDVAELPLSPHTKTRGSSLNGLANSVNARSKNVEAAVDFVKFLGSKEAALVLGTTGTVIPSHLDAVMSYFKPGVLPANQAAFARAAAYGHLLPVNRYIGAGFEARIDAAMTDILDGKVGVEKALKEAEDDINAMIKAALSRAEKKE
ncbi:MAG TPA: sugar ABC transporter substrate-binding protein [Firmicutes bacterium]|nr:sugar ABC transporter substrate-binding protein [Bacillota bacterium]